MSLWSKFILVLSFKFRIKIFLSKELQVASNLLARPSKQEILGNHKIVRCRYLVFDENRRSTKPIEQVKVFLYILRNRMVRSILITSQALSQNVEFFEISRFKLMWVIFRKRRVLSENLMCKFSFEFLEFAEYSSFKSLKISYKQSIPYLKSFQAKQKFVVEKPDFQPFRIVIHNSVAPSYPNLEKFILWNSTIFREFVRAHDMQKTLDEILKFEYPMVYAEVYKYQNGEFKDFDYADRNLDDVFEEFGIDSYEVISDAQIWHQRFIYSQDLFVNLDITSSPSQKFVAGVSAFIESNVYNQSQFLVEVPTGREFNLSEAIFLCGRADENWYHFLIDTLPRILFFDAVPPEVPLLVRGDIPSTTKEFLGKITNRRIIEVQPEELVRVGRLYIRPGRSSVFDTLQPNSHERIEFPSRVLGILKKRIFAAFELDVNIESSNILALHRNSTNRNVVNWRSIKEVLSKLDIPFYYLNDEFFRNQVKVFFDSQLVVAPGGAVLANMLFMQPRSKVVVLHSSRSSALGIWRKLAEACDLEFLEVYGLPTYYGFNYLRRLHSSFYISPKKLRRMLFREI